MKNIADSRYREKWKPSFVKEISLFHVHSLKGAEVSFDY